MSDVSLYGPEQSRFARLLERRELRRPDPVARELRRRLLSGPHANSYTANEISAKTP